ncbi:hypothetical protein AKJ40_04460 [candidate division MSBL1 archaeon SCGC-AAA259M10]|uniref:Uncharacterized protein n=2 Tax=candidate division MSBL1 TaxID=215777 RepID=A0A656YV68_9EURY|nr:hypothetical protein AKJ39_04325 [candidate division MSBL1 archaeon SCGC-AAA259J03]KXA98784.1 hypothetical protein AKJ40_04460 [candidate division MSBL1 archaeon SCGC-AAA259M10]
MRRGPVPGYDELVDHYERQLDRFKRKDIPPMIVVGEGCEVTPVIGLSEEFRERREGVEKHEPGDLEEDPAARLMYLICLFTPDRKVARFYDKLTLELLHEFRGDEAEIF